MRIMKRVAVFLAMMVTCAGAFADPDIDLYNAVKLNRLGDVQYALSRGANPNQKIATNGKSSFELAVENGNKVIVETMLKDSRVPVAINGDSDSEPPLFIAVRDNNPDMIDFLLKNNANVNLRYKGDCVLFYLLKAGCSTVTLKSLIESNRKYHSNMDYKVTDMNGNTVLHYAASGGDFYTFVGGDVHNLDALLKTGEIRPEIQNDNGDTILHMAFKGQNIKMAQRILDDISAASLMMNKFNKDGLTPMGAFVEFCHSAGYIDEEIFRSMVSLPGINVSIFSGGKEAKSKNVNNGLITLAEIDDQVAARLYRNRQFKLQSVLATIEDNEGNPFLCLAIQEKWSPELVDLMLDNTDSRDWKKIKMKTGKYRGLNAIEIMRKNRTEDLYEDVFDEYM